MNEQEALIGIGGNLTAPGHADLQSGLDAAIAALATARLRLCARAPWYRSPPWPPSDQPWFLNSVLQVRTDLSPAALLCHLLEIERSFGRVRSVANAARTLDLDILDYGGRVSDPGADPILPHPRLTARGFVLRPLADLCPNWTHPVSGQSITDLLAALPADTGLRPAR